MKVIIFFSFFVLVYANIDGNGFAPKPPNLITSGENLMAIVTKNEPITLSCNFSGLAKETYEWNKINGSQRINVTAEGNVPDCRPDGDVIMRFAIENVTEINEVTYQCIAVHPKHGNRVGNISLKIVDDPDVEISFANVSKPTGSVHLNWTLTPSADENDRPEYYVIEYALKNATQFYSKNIPSNESHYDIKELEDNTDYRFRIWAFNNNRTRISPYSGWVRTSVSAMEENGNQFIPNVSIVRYTENSITIKWEGPQEGLAEKIGSYRINASDGYTKRQPPGAANKDVIHELKDLNCSTNYSIRVEVCSLDDSEKYRESREIYGRTSDCIVNSAASFYPQINTVMAIVFALYLLASSN